MSVTLSDRRLNRATLARQHLLARVPLTPLRAIEHLVGLQAQAPNPPYIGLWSRLVRFTPEDLASLLTGRKVVRMVLMRSTIHLVTARDAVRLEPTLRPVQERNFFTGSPYGRRLHGLDLDALVSYGRRLVEQQPRTLAQLRPLLAARWPGFDSQAMAYGIRNLVPLVQIPPRGVWGSGGLPLCTTAEAWLGTRLTGGADPRALVLRYLGAFGPASVRDAQTWSGLSGLREVFDALRRRLQTFRSEAGTELFDLPAAPRPDDDVVPPVRFLGEFDNLLLSHADRSRLLDDEHRRRIGTLNGMVPGTVLVDGRVAGIWKIERARGAATLGVRSFRPLLPRVKRALEHEGAGLLRFAASDAPDHDVRFSPLRSP